MRIELGWSEDTVRIGAPYHPSEDTAATRTCTTTLPFIAFHDYYIAVRSTTHQKGTVYLKYGCFKNGTFLETPVSRMMIFSAV